MNIYNYLKQDHQKVADIFEKIITTTSKVKRKTLFSDLNKELLIHADSEHETFYKALKKNAEMKDIINHADKEHAEVKEYLEKINNLPAGSDEWLVKIGELKHAVEHHVEDEETEIFKKAKKILDKKLEKDLVEDMEAYKEKFIAEGKYQVET